MKRVMKSQSDPKKKEMPIERRTKRSDRDGELKKENRRKLKRNLCNLKI
jgi:hypothetical protein